MAGEQEVVQSSSGGSNPLSNVLNLVGTTADIITTLAVANKNRKFNAAESRKQREWTERMWHMENEYNTPANQVQRLIDAGLNPNLAYGQMDMSPISVGSGAEASFSSLPSFSALSDIGLRNAQIENLEAQTKKTEKSTELTEQQIATEIERAGLVKEEAKKMASDIKLNEQKYKEIGVNIIKLKAEARAADEKADLTYEEVRRYRATFDDYCRQFAAQTKITDEEARRVVRYWALKLAGMQADIDEKNQHVKLMQEMGDYYQKNAKLLETQEGQISFMVELQKRYGDYEKYYNLLKVISDAYGSSEMSSVLRSLFVLDRRAYGIGDEPPLPTDHSND